MSDSIPSVVAFLAGAAAGALTVIVLLAILVLQQPRVSRIVRAYRERRTAPQYHRTLSEESLAAGFDRTPSQRRNRERQEWLADFYAAHPALDLSTPEGLAEALALQKQQAHDDNLPRYQRREMGLL